MVTDQNFVLLEIRNFVSKAMDFYSSQNIWVEFEQYLWTKAS